VTDVHKRADEGHGPGSEIERAHAHPAPESHGPEGNLTVHHPRRTDVDPKAARRAERQVSLLFVIGMLTPIAFWLEYVYIPRDKIVYIPIIQWTSASNFFLGITMGIGLLCVGAGAIHWAKKLMPDVEEVGDRHAFRGTDEERATAVTLFDEGVQSSGFLRYRMIRRTMIGALAATPLFAIPLLKDLGPMPGNFLRQTLWKKNERIVRDVSYQPIKPADIPIGGLVSCVPASLPAEQEASGNQNQAAKSPVILVRMRPEQIKKQQGPNWDYEGILCYSKICTHVGCPTALYEQKTHHLLCPCHQSTFDLADAGRVIFGPAARAMPQLPITVDSEGYLVARSDFHEPIGPSFWERG
jgi:ubiquinol-cytochrome c reductase iron-sulfur subunit